MATTAADSGWRAAVRIARFAPKGDVSRAYGAYHARGLALAFTMARHYGLRKLAIPSAGNAAGALAAYAAAADIEAHIYGAHVTLVDGLISDRARIVAERKNVEGWFDVSTLKEPYRIEGKKTMGYELVEQLGWEYPDAVFYPTGGGVGLIGMCLVLFNTGAGLKYADVIEAALASFAG